MGLGPAVFAGPAMQVTPTAAGASISVAPKRTPFGFLELVEPGTGRVVYTLNAGRFPAGQSFTVSKNIAVAPGRYTLRYREGFDLKLLGELKRPEAKMPAWLNPTCIVQRGQNLYILDSGLDVVETRPDHLNDLTWNPVTGKPVAAHFVEIKDGIVNLQTKEGAAVTFKLADLKAADQAVANKLDKERLELLAERDTKQSALFKMDTKGVLDTAFGKGGKLALPGYYNIRSFDVDPASGVIYISAGGHNAIVFDASGKLTPQTIGGWDGDPNGPKCTVWVNTLFVGAGNRLYLPNGYGNIKVYDRTKNAFDGILYFGLNPASITLDACGATDGLNAVYITTPPGVIRKFIDDGKSIKAAYASSDADKLAMPTGPSASAGLVWVAAHGPGPGPFWDSGGGGEVALYFDDGQKLQLLGRFGVPGTAGDQLEFMNPSSAYLTADHLELRVVEDGLTNTEGPKGNARVRLFQIASAYTEEAVVDVK
jgi:hypothetical protein